MAGLTGATSGSGNNAGQPAYPTPSAVQPANATPTLHEARKAFVDTALFKCRTLTIPVANPSAGQQFDIQCGKVGYSCGIMIIVDAELTTTLVPSVSKRYPYNLISSVIYQDPSNDQQRVISDGYFLYLRERLGSKRFPWDPSVSSPLAPAYGAGLYLAPTTLPSGATQNLHFHAWLPLTVEEPEVMRNGYDLRGIHSLASAKKTATLTLTINPNIFSATASDDALTYHNAGVDGCVLTTCTIRCFQYYWTPVDPDGSGFVLPPMDDQIQVLEFKSEKAQALYAGGDTPYAYQTGRTYRRNVGELVSNGLLTTGNVKNYTAPAPGVTSVKFMLNDNNYLLWEDIDVYLWRMRASYGEDMPTGIFVWDHTGREYNSDEYSDLQDILVLDPAFSTAGTSYFKITRECTYESDITQQAA